MIHIKPSPTADTRTCDVSLVCKSQLMRSSTQHIQDVQQGLLFFIEKLIKAGIEHDQDKITGLDQFYADFTTKFQDTTWWDKHRIINRHHLTKEDGIPINVNLLDILEFIVDCTMAGKARSGKVYDLEMSPELLYTAFQNTVTLLATNVTVDEDF